MNNPTLTRTRRTVCTVLAAAALAALKWPEVIENQNHFFIPYAYK